MKDTNGTELFNLEKNVAFPIFGCCYSNYFLPGYGLCCKYFCLPCFRFVTLQFTMNFCYRSIFRCQAGDAEMKMISGNKKYNIKHIPNVSGHPTIDITSPEPSSITSDSFTVVLPSCCMLPYKCNDVIYDVKGKIDCPLRSGSYGPTSVHGLDGSNLFNCLRGQVDSFRVVVCVRLVLFPRVLAQSYFKTVLRKVNR